MCSSEFDSNQIAQFYIFRTECVSSLETSYNTRIVLSLVIKPSARYPVISESMGVFKIYNSPKNTYFIKFKGFDIESNIEINNSNGLFFQSTFSLYKNKRLIKTCEEFTGTKFNGFIFQPREKSGLLKFFLIKQLPSKHPVCSLFFKNARINDIEFNYIMNSFYFQRILTFCDPLFVNNTKISDDLNSTITGLTIHRTFGLDVNSKLLHPKIFANLTFINLNCLINSIEMDVFKPFKNLREIYFIINNIRTMIRKQGIAWIKAINSDINVDLKNQTDINRNFMFYFQIDYTFDRYFLSQKNIHFFYDEDFCLFVDFPFHQMVFFRTDSFERINILLKAIPFTCTELWLFQYYNIINKSNEFTIKKLNSSNFTACFFQERQKLCQKSRFQTNPINTAQHGFTSLDFVYILELIFIILLPILSLFSIFANLKTIRVILHKDNKKTMRQNHYLYLSAYCLSNIIISFTQILNIMSECQDPFGFFCSQIGRHVFVQYIKIIFGEYLNNTFRFFSNFAYLGFSIGRLARIGKDHGKLVVFLNDLSIPKYIISSLVMSAILALCKPFQFKINYFYRIVNIFPLPIFEYVPIWREFTTYMIVFIFNFIFNIINYFLFVFIHLIVDVVLIGKLIKVLEEKEIKMKEMKKTTKEMDEASKENEEAKRRTVLMVVLNSTLNFCTRIPLMITSVNDLRLLIQRSFNRFESLVSINVVDQFSPLFTLKFYCSSVKACLVFRSLGNCLYLFSLSTILFFCKYFDKNFKKAYEVCFARNSSKKNFQN